MTKKEKRLSGQLDKQAKINSDCRTKKSIANCAQCEFYPCNWVIEYNDLLNRIVPGKFYNSRKESLCK